MTADATKAGRLISQVIAPQQPLFTKRAMEFHLTLNLYAR